MELRGNYIRKYETATERDTDRWSENYYEPWVSAVVEDGEVDYNKSEYERLLGTPLTFIVESDGDIKWVTTNANNKVTLEYSKNEGETWTQVTSDIWASAPVISVASGETVMFRCANDTANTANNNFSGTSCGFSLRGNIMSLLKKEGFAIMDSFPASSIFARFFRTCTGLSDASELLLPVTALANNCYESMFESCTSLTAAPELPATTLANYCYMYMFLNCTSLTTVPSILPAATLTNFCYHQMFKDCGGLVKAPEILGTTVVENCCHSMFYNCTAMTIPPTVLLSATLSNQCYKYMFKGCKSLATAPILSATTLANNCYYGMFEDCTSLTQAPELPVTTLAESCYREMFYGCTSLTTAPELPATTLVNNCYQMMFQNCTSLTTAPSVLAATTLASNCYYNMFNNCTSLTTAPELPATTLTEKSYFQMFYNCRNLTYIKCLARDISASNCTYNWVTGVAASGTFVKDSNMPVGTDGWPQGNNGVPANWTVQDAS